MQQVKCDDKKEGIQGRGIERERETERDRDREKRKRERETERHTHRERERGSDGRHEMKSEQIR